MNLNEQTDDQFKLDCITLGLSHDFDKDTLKQRYRELAKKYHPDRPGGSKRVFDELKAAFERLSKFVRDNLPSTFEGMRREADAMREEWEKSGYQNPELTRMMQNYDMNNADNREALRQRFNKAFDEVRTEHAFDQGYGDFMVNQSAKDEIDVKTGSRPDVPIDKKIDPDNFTRKDFNEQFRKDTNPSTKAIVQHNDPEPAEIGGQNVGQVIHTENMVDDYSGAMTCVNNGPQLPYSDYKLAHTTSRLVDPKTVKKSKYCKYGNDLEALKKKREREVENYDFELSRKDYEDRIKRHYQDLYQRDMKLQKEEKNIEDAFNVFSRKVIGNE